MKKVVNLCPHVMSLPGGTWLPASKEPARCTEIDEPVGEWNGIPLISRRYSEVYNLPEPQEDTIYVVSLIVRNALPERLDLASPGTLIRDAGGNVIGCQNLAVSKDFVP